MKHILNNLNDIWRMEEIKAKKRARDRDVVEGDTNTAYFRAMANQRRKKAINILDGPNGPVEDIKGMLSLAVEYYKKLFSFEARLDIKLGEGFWGEDEKISAEDRNGD